MTAVPTVRGHDLETSAGRGRWFGLAVIVLAQLLVVLDSTVLAVALPSAQQDLGFSDASRQWVLTAYTLAFGGCCCSAAGSRTGSASRGAWRWA